MSKVKKYHNLISKKSLPPKPTRDQLINVQIHFQGLQILSDTYGDNFPIFEIFLPSLSEHDHGAVWQQKNILGDTHAHVALAYKYNEPGQPYQNIPGGDFTKNLELFREIILDRVMRGFWPIVSLAADGQVFNPDGWTYGYSYVYDNMEDIMGSFEDLLDYCVIMGGFELLGPGGNWTPQQVDDFYIKLRSTFIKLGHPNAVSACELGQGYDKWYEDGVFCWSQPGGQAIDVFLQELPQPVQSNLDGCQQLASRNLGPKAKNIAPRNVGAWYQVTGTPRGVRGNCAFEFGLYSQLHQGWNPDEINDDRLTLKNYGWSSTG